MEVSKVHIDSLLKTLVVLEPYLDEIVIIGGWVPLLYRRYGKLSSRHPSLRTIDIDIVVPGTLKEVGRPTIDELLIQAGYEAPVYGSDISSATKYKLRSPVTEVEFLTPEVGLPGRPFRTVQRGLTAQRLRYLAILLENINEIRVSDDLPPGSTIDLIVRIPSPAAFIYQKGLTLVKRHSKVAKDLYYIFDLIDSADELLQSILSEMAIMREKYPRSWFKTFLKNLEQYFPEDNAEGPVLVASQYTGEMQEGIFRRYAHHTFRDFIQLSRELP